MNTKKTFYVTTPIFYPSGKLHIGHVYTSSIAETIKNYKKMQGYNVLFLTGSDEHGEKIEQKAIANNKSPQKYVDEMYQKNIELWKKMDINYDIYMRTTFDFHKKTIQKVFSKLLSEGIIYKSHYEGLYSVQDEEFFTITQAVEKDGKYYSPISNHLLKKIKEESYFFKMSDYQTFLIDYFNANPDFITPKKIVKELTNSFLKKGLDDLSITRTAFKWGIPVKEDDKHVIYVWLDALCNYITALGYMQDNEKNFKTYWENQNTEILHIIGKEITRFHCIYWPIILKTLNLKLPTTILSHGWIITKTGKMSKSKGNVIDPLEVIKEYSPEVLKYYLITQIPMGDDGTFDINHLKEVYNADLVNNFGNLVSRTIAMSIKNFGENAPKYVGTPNKYDLGVEENISKYFDKYVENMDKFNIPKAFKNVIKLSKSLNKYIDLTMPWKLKNDDSKELESILNHLFNGFYAVAAMMNPIIQQTNLNVLAQIGFKEFKFKEIKNMKKFDDKTIIKKQILFIRKK